MKEDDITAMFMIAAVILAVIMVCLAIDIHYLNIEIEEDLLDFSRDFRP